MIFDQFKVDILQLLQSSNVNLGRKNTKTRQELLDAIANKFDTCRDYFTIAERRPTDKKQNKNADSSVSDEQITKPSKKKDIMRIKPADSNRVLDVGKGVKAMTPSESQRADEQLNRSPYAANTDQEG